MGNARAGLETNGGQGTVGMGAGDVLARDVLARGMLRVVCWGGSIEDGLMSYGTVHRRVVRL